MENNKMNVYKMIANCYKKDIENGDLSNATKRKIEIYDFLATCSLEDLCQMVDSSAFNGIITAFLIQSLNNINIDEENKKKIMKNLAWTFDEMTASEVLENSYRK